MIPVLDSREMISKKAGLRGENERIHGYFINSRVLSFRTRAHLVPRGDIFGSSPRVLRQRTEVVIRRRIGLPTGVHLWCEVTRLHHRRMRHNNRRCTVRRGDGGGGGSRCLARDLRTEELKKEDQWYIWVREKEEGKAGG